jgi:hypothetical protein
MVDEWTGSAAMRKGIDGWQGRKMFMRRMEVLGIEL